MRAPRTAGSGEPFLPAPTTERSQPSLSAAAAQPAQRSSGGNSAGKRHPVTRRATALPAGGPAVAPGTRPGSWARPGPAAARAGWSRPRRERGHPRLTGSAAAGAARAGSALAFPSALAALRPLAAGPQVCAGRRGSERGGAALPSPSGPARPPQLLGGPVTWGGGAAVRAPPPAPGRERGPAMGPPRRAPAALPAPRRAGAPRAAGSPGSA